MNILIAVVRRTDRNDPACAAVLPFIGGRLFGGKVNAVSCGVLKVRWLPTVVFLSATAVWRIPRFLSGPQAALEETRNPPFFVPS
jgi:hypothetical protein